MHDYVNVQGESDFYVGGKTHLKTLLGFFVWLGFFSYQNIKAHNYTSSGMKVCRFHGNQNFISDNVKRRKESKSLAFILQSLCIS